MCVRFKETMVSTVGYRRAELSLQFGLMYSATDALKIGLVDQLVPEENILSTATEAMTKWLLIPGHKLPLLPPSLRTERFSHHTLSSHSF